MQNTQNTPSEVFVTITKNGPRFYRSTGLRRFPISRQVAEAAFAAGATIYHTEADHSHIARWEIVA